MRCPYDSKVDACLYLDTITPACRCYHCENCPHYAPSPLGYYDQKAQHEGFSVLVAAVSIGAIAGTFIVVALIKLIKLIVSCL